MIKFVSEDELRKSVWLRQVAKLSLVLLLYVQLTVSEQNVSSEYKSFQVKYSKKRTR